MQGWRKNVLGSVATKQTTLFNRLEQVWFDNYEFDPDTWILCDQFAAMVALDKAVVTEKRPKKATVELGGHLARGCMFLEQRAFEESKEGFRTNVVIVDKLDEEIVKKMLLDSFSFEFNK